MQDVQAQYKALEAAIQLHATKAKAVDELLVLSGGAWLTSSYSSIDVARDMEADAGVYRVLAGEDEDFPIVATELWERLVKRDVSTEADPGERAMDCDEAVADSGCEETDLADDGNAISLEDRVNRLDNGVKGKLLESTDRVFDVTFMPTPTHRCLQ